MNIKKAKDEIRNSIRAYLTRNPQGEYAIPAVRQRPILLMGPPGIGKTAIMEQVAEECNIALVSYTITHHTRQSAVGLPYIEKMYYNKESYSVTQYTLSEIIASVYDKISKSNLSEGILFIDEINCVSETLAPTMLQFLQCKTFGNHRVPEGWIIVAAGNPPEYNKSVREFDIVTLDRVKRIDVEPDYEVWKEYAYKSKIHGSIMSYLELKKDRFYDVRTTADGKVFVTARGWEDLSVIITAYEKLGIKVDYELALEYIQHPSIALDFANYYDLYNKYRADYGIDDILKGRLSDEIRDRLKSASFDERYSIIAHLLSGLTTIFAEADLQTRYVSNIFDMLKETMEIYEKSSENIRTDANKVTDDARERLRRKIAANAVSGNALTAMQGAIRYVDDAALRFGAGSEHNPVTEEAFAGIKKDFERIKNEREEVLKTASEYLSNSFDFILKVFGEEQELVMFVTELSVNYYAVSYINDEGCDLYTYYASKFLVGDRQREIMEDIRAVRENESL
ncbi:MAG: AAA family ATPase [Butyrivibrio sp.]|nr:AAA family ATPase [Butyrivibrio sp.]